jgi:hypothetical protein
MKRSALEHLIRAAGAIANDPEIVIIGSQSILGQYPNATGVLSVSAEANLYPLHRPELAELIDGAIGEGSSFHEEFGYYAQGVDERTATLPKGWKQRLIRIQNENTGPSAGLCLEVHDLAISKYVAGREKDWAFTRELAQQGFIQKPVLTERLAETELPDALRPIVQGRIQRDFA